MNAIQVRTAAGKTPAGKKRAGQGDGSPRQEHRNLADSFRSVEACGINELYVACGRPNQGLEVRADGNLLPSVTTRVEDGVLHIEAPADLATRTPIAVTLFAENLDNLTLSGSVQAQVEGLKAESFGLKVGGEAVAVLNGSAGELQVESGGKSRVFAEQLEPGKVKAESCAGSVVYLAPARLTANASGSGRIHFLGKPTVRKTLAGKAKVERVEASDIERPSPLTPLCLVRTSEASLVAGLAAALFGAMGVPVAQNAIQPKA